VRLKDVLTEIGKEESTDNEDGETPEERSKFENKSLESRFLN